MLSGAESYGAPITPGRSERLLSSASQGTGIAGVQLEIQSMSSVMSPASGARMHEALGETQLQSRLSPGLYSGPAPYADSAERSRAAASLGGSMRALTRDGRPLMDFAAAPSLFLEEDIRQENLLLVHRTKVCEDLKTSEINEAQAVHARSSAEQFAEQKIAEERSAAARAAEAREIEVRAVEQRSAIEAAYSDAEMQARAAIARAQELREMLQSARSEQERASGERADTAAQAEQAAQIARQAEAQAVEARRAQDCAYSERKSLEAKAYRIAPINSALSARGGYLMD